MIVEGGGPRLGVAATGAAAARNGIHITSAADRRKTVVAGIVGRIDDVRAARAGIRVGAIRSCYSNGDMTSVTDANGKVLETHTYDASHRGLTSGKIQCSAIRVRDAGKVQ